MIELKNYIKYALTIPALTWATSCIMSMENVWGGGAFMIVVLCFQAK